jgi:hypothetical protein
MLRCCAYEGDGHPKVEGARGSAQRDDDSPHAVVDGAKRSDEYWCDHQISNQTYELRPDIETRASF